MFDIGWTELLLIGIVALIVIGPKDLPALFHNLGRFTAKARSMARDFSRAMEEAARESGVGDVTKDLRDVANPRKLGLDKVREAADRFEKWDPTKPTKPGGTEDGDPAAKPEREMGPHTRALSEERAEASRKIREATAAKARARQEAAKAKAAAETSETADKAADSGNSTT